MNSEESAFLAASAKHHQNMAFGKKQRYIEVFQCSGDDMKMVLAGGMPPIGVGGLPQTPTPLLSPGMFPLGVPGWDPLLQAKALVGGNGLDPSFRSLVPSPQLMYNIPQQTSPTASAVAAAANPATSMFLLNMQPRPQLPMAYSAATILPTVSSTPSLPVQYSKPPPVAAPPLALPGPAPLAIPAPTAPLALPAATPLKRSWEQAFPSSPEQNAVAVKRQPTAATVVTPSTTAATYPASALYPTMGTLPLLPGGISPSPLYPTQ